MAPARNTEDNILVANERDRRELVDGKETKTRANEDKVNNTTTPQQRETETGNLPKRFPWRIVRHQRSGSSRNPNLSRAIRASSTLLLLDAVDTGDGGWEMPGALGEYPCEHSSGCWTVTFPREA